MNEDRKVLIIGIDGGSWSLFKPMLTEGEMPNLKKMVENGASGILKSTIPPLTPAAWSSFLTGVNPGKHGILHFSNFDKTSGETNFVSSESLKIKNIWEYLNSLDKKAILINIPMTYPPKPVLGKMITGMLTPSVDSSFTFPESLKKEINENINEGWIIEDHKRISPHKDFHGFIDQMIKILDNRVNIALYLIKKYDWDFFIINFQCVDQLQHPLWKYLDKKHPYFEEKKYKFIVSSFYRKLDEAVGILITEAKKKDSASLLSIIFSDHGFQPHFKKVYLNNWLYKNGFLKLSRMQFLKDPLNYFLPILKKFDFLKLRKKFISKKRARDIVIQYQKKRIDRNNSTAFAIGSFWGYIFLRENISAKEKRLLIKKLKDFTDDENKQKVIKSIYTKNEIYCGEEFDRLPDLILEPNNGYTFFSHTYFDKSRFIQNVNPHKEYYIGTHHIDGIVVFESPETEKKFLKAEIIDIAPTILYYIDLPIPNYMDGRVIQEIFNSEFKKNNAPIFVDISMIKPVKEDFYYSEPEEEKIKDRLKMLGYLD